VLRDMARQGATILLVIHDMEQLARLADDVLLLSGGHGRWVSPDALLDQHSGLVPRAPRLPITFPEASHAGTA